MLLVRATTKNGRDLLLIGLSAANRHRLDAGQPIRVRAYTSPDQDAPLEIVIFTDETEDAMQSQLSTLLGDSTVVRDRPTWAVRA